MHSFTRNKQTVPQGFPVLLAGFLILMFIYGSQLSYGIFFKPVLGQFRWTREVTSGAYSLNMGLSGGLAIIGGRLTDRFGAKRVVISGGIFSGVGYVLMSQITSVWQIYLFFGVILGIGSACIWVPIMSATARWFVKRRGLMSGVMASGVGAGTVAMAPLANWLISHYNWRTSYIILGLIVLGVCLVAAQFLRRDPNQPVEILKPGTEARLSHEATTPGLSAREAIRNRQFWIISAVFFCFGFCLQTVIVHIVPYATDTGVPAAVAASILSIIGALGIVGRIVLGGAADRLGSRRTQVIGLVLMTSSFFLVLFASQLWMLYVFAVVFALGYGALVAVQSPIVYEFFGLTAHGVIFGLAGAGMSVGGAIGPLLAGRLFDTTDSYDLAFTLCTALSVSGLILASLLRPMRRKREPAGEI
jgi:MFS family permease